MKTLTRSLLIVISGFLALGFNGCILDAFDTLTQGFPISKEITISGTQTSIEESTIVNLDESDFYNSNKDKINKIVFLKAAYRTYETPTPADLQGTIQVTIKQGGPSGLTLFSKSVPNAKASDYITDPYEFPLTQAEIQLVNTFLANTTNRVLYASVSVSNLNEGNKTLHAVVDMVFEMEIETGD